MPLADVNLRVEASAVPREIRSFLREARRRIFRFQHSHHVPAFVAGDFPRFYAVLQTLAAAELAPSRMFCEWGSGYGVVACLAAMLDFDACGIEIDADLVDGARQLAEDFSLAVEFVCGSFIPAGGAALLADDDRYGWLTTDEGNSLDELDLAPDDFGVICAYPWPDEEQLTDELFERYAGPDALLLTFQEGEGFRLRRKTTGCS